LSDPFKYTVIAHANRKFLGPYDQQTLEDLVDFPSTCILDIGCGKGAALAVLGGRGFGIEHNPVFADEAQKQNPNAEIWQEDAKTALSHLPQSPDLIVCMGSSQAIGSPAEAMATLASMIPSGGHVLFGDGYWRQEPDPDYLAFLGAKRDDVGSFGDGKILGENFGLKPLRSRESNNLDWSKYEDSYQQAVLDWCKANPDDPDAGAFEARITAWREAYERWGKYTLGFGIHLFKKP
jgi:SAM-dependent methyltransferase